MVGKPQSEATIVQRLALLPRVPLLVADPLGTVGCEQQAGFTGRGAREDAEAGGEHVFQLLLRNIKHGFFAQLRRLDAIDGERA